jgi:hypothetical protein
MKARYGALCATLFFMLLAGSARGDAAGMAIELFTQGKQLMGVGDYTEARVRLAESARLDPKVGTLASLAVCEERLGHLAEAHARWQQARTLAMATNDARRPLTENELARIDRLVPKLSIEVRGGSPPGLLIKADDLDVGPGMLRTPLPVNPGAHTISATAPGKRPWSTQVQTEADGKVTPVVVGPLEDALATAAPTGPAREAPPEAPLPPPPGGGEGSHGWRSQRLFGIVVTGVGAAGLAVGGAFGFRAIALKKDRSTYCDANNVCSDPQGLTLDHDARTAATTSTITMAAGGAVAVGGLVLILTAPHGAPPVTVGASFQRGGAEFNMAGRW